MVTSLFRLRVDHPLYQPSYSPNLISKSRSPERGGYKIIKEVLHLETAHWLDLFHKLFALLSFIW